MFTQPLLLRTAHRGCIPASRVSLPVSRGRSPCFPIPAAVHQTITFHRAKSSSKEGKEEKTKKVMEEIQKAREDLRIQLQKIQAEEAKLQVESKKGKYVHEITIDQSELLRVGDAPQLGMSGVPEHLKQVKKSAHTPLVDELRAAIQAKGPISIAEFMNQALLNPRYGYYTTQVCLGSQGDFITSPEFSDLFNEMITVWCLDSWIKLGRPKTFDLIELGGGTGALMKFVLELAQRADAEFCKSVRLHMVDPSPFMRWRQAQRLQVEEVTVDGQVYKIADLDGKQHLLAGDYVSGTSGIAGIPVNWYTTFVDVPGHVRGTGSLLSAEASPDAHQDEGSSLGLVDSTGRKLKTDSSSTDVPCLVLGHEVLDAFPVHQFRMTPRGWREIMVDVDDREDPESHYFRFVLANTSTPAADILLRHAVLPKSRQQTKDPKNKFLSYLQEEEGNDGSSASAPRAEPSETTVSTERRDKAALSGFTKFSPNTPESSTVSEGAAIEISPLALALVEDITKRLAGRRGACLLIDYGRDYTMCDTLQGLKQHKHIEALAEPGRIDLTTLVDFKSVANVVDRTAETIKSEALKFGQPDVVKPIRRYSLMDQGEFLVRIGILERVKAFLARPHVTDEEKRLLVSQYERLVDPEQMGVHFKAFCFSSDDLPQPPTPWDQLETLDSNV